MNANTPEPAAPSRPPYVGAWTTHSEFPISLKGGKKGGPKGGKKPPPMVYALGALVVAAVGCFALGLHHTVADLVLGGEPAAPAQQPWTQAQADAGPRPMRAAPMHAAPMHAAPMHAAPMHAAPMHAAPMPGGKPKAPGHPGAPAHH